MDIYILRIFFIVLFLVNVSTAKPYVPGTPGIKWTEEQAAIIQVGIYLVFFVCIGLPVM